MKTRLLAMGLAAISAALVACGGGGNNPNPTPPTPVTPTSSPTPSYFSNYPAAAGDTFAFAGTLTTQTTYTQPAASPLPSTTQTANVTQNVTVSDGGVPWNASALASIFTSVEGDAGPNMTSQFTTQTYYSLTGNATAGSLASYGFSQTDSLGDNIKYEYVSPATVAQLPFASGATWTNSAKSSVVEKDADGTTATRTYAADGSYNDTQTFAYGTATIQENADGSGTYDSPVFLSALFGGTQTYVFSAPSKNAITVTAYFPAPPAPTPNASGSPSPSPNPTSTPLVQTLSPAWYAAGAPLYTESDKDNGSVAIPASCKVPASFGTQAEQLTQTITRLDTILGTSETQTTTGYIVPSFGPACLVMSDVTNDYYDYTGDVQVNQTLASLFAYFPTAYKTTTITETVTLQSESVKTASRAVQARPMQAITPRAFEIAHSAFMAAVERERQARANLAQHAMLLYFKNRESAR